MKLAEALQERADINRRIEQVKRRLFNNAVVQEGEKPAENPQELLAELDLCISTLENLMYRINLTNCKTMIDGQSLTELIAKKDCLVAKISAYRDLVSNASQLAHRASRTEIKILSTVNVKEIQQKIDVMSKELRLLDNRMQEMNWKTELQ